MAKQTINIGTAPNDGTGTPLRTAFDYCNLNFTELYTAVGPSGNNIVVPGNATITGDLTVRTNGLVVDSNGASFSNATPLSGVDSGLLVGAVGNSKAIAISMFNCLARLRERDAVNNFAITTNINATGTLDDNTRSSWKVRFGSGNENFVLQRAAAGSTTFQDLLIVDNGGNCSWYDGAGGTRMTLNATGLGVGGSPNAKVSCAGFSSANVAPDFQINRSSSGTGIQTGPNLTFADGTANNTVAIQSTQGRFGVWNFGAGAWNERFNVDAAGNVGVGVTPSAWNAAFRGIDISTGGAIAGSSDSVRLFSNSAFNTAGNNVYKNAATAGRYDIQGNVHTWNISTNTPSVGGTITFTQAMTLDASGNLLVGTTTAGAKITALAGASGQAAIFEQPAQNFWCVLAHNKATSGDNSFVLFGTEASFTSRGSITYNRAAGQVAYNITSDYRLKEDIKPLTGAINRIASLKPSTYKLKETGSVCEGFIAHELAEVVPMAVTGEKDAVDADGKPVYQAVDLSKVTPLLVAAIKELTARVQTLEAK